MSMSYKSDPNRQARTERFARRKAWTDAKKLLAAAKRRNASDLADYARDERKAREYFLELED